MHKRKFLFILMIALAGAGLAGYGILRPHAGPVASKALYYCPMHTTYTSDKPGSCPICSMKLVLRQEKQNPEQAENTGGPRLMTLEEFLKLKPHEICGLHKCKMGTCLLAPAKEMALLGKCPHCGENLGILFKDLLPDGYTHVMLTPEKQRQIGLKTVPVQKRTLHKTLRTAGKIAYDPELYEMERDYLEAWDAYRRMGTGQKEMNKARLQLKRMGLNDELIAEIEGQRKPDSLLINPKKSGQIWVYMPVYEQEFFLIRPGQKIEVEAPAIPGKKFEGVIRAVSETPDPLTRTVVVRGRVENPEALLKLQMDVNVLIGIERGAALMVPGDAVFSTGERDIVFLARPGGVFEPREVKLGILADEGREIRSGLTENDEVVISGNFLIDSESRLKASLEGAGTAEGGHQHGG